jgi:hypothetical protein
MIRARYEPADAEALAPLLRSIGRELEERGRRLAEIEARLEELRNSPFFEHDQRNLEAEAAAHRSALRECRKELERLGCSVLGTAPLRISIPTDTGGTRGSRVWQHGPAKRD